jgi:two-component system nitrogen regulation response regulator NtrX
MEANAKMINGKKILVVDDHRNIRVTLAMTLEGEGATVTQAENFHDGLVKMGKLDSSDFPFDVVLLDIRLPDGSGLDILKGLSTANLASRVIMISGEGTTTDAFKATQLGAFDYVEKPFAPERIIVSVGRCLDFNHIQTTVDTLEKRLRKGHEIIGNSAAINDLSTKIRRVAPTNGRVLIIGESGTGKELVSREIHRFSTRSKNELVKINCAAIPATLIESELFGHEKGAFTGAIKTRRGLFERADGGTLFLDEIGEIEMSVQAKLLRVLQSGEMVRVGGEKSITVDVRVIAATNRNLSDMVEAGTFREDLYYRLNVVTLEVPPLRDRGDDIKILATQFLAEACDEHSLGERNFSEAALEKLMTYRWPGNIRELKNLVERIAILSEQPVIDTIEGIDSDDIVMPPPSGKIQPIAGEFFFGSKLLPWQEFHQLASKAYIKFVLQNAAGNVSEAARILCLERAYLHRLMRKLGVQRDIVVSE